MRKLILFLLFLTSCALNKPVYDFSAYDKIVYRNEAKIYKIGYFFSSDHSHVIISTDTLLSPSSKIECNFCLQSSFLAFRLLLP